MLACQLIVDMCDDIFLLRKEISFDVLKKHLGLFLLCVYRWLGTPYIFAVAFTQGWHSLVTAWQKIGQRMGLLALTTGTSSLHWQITAFHTSAKLHHCFHSVLHLDSIVWRLFQLSPSGFGAPKVAGKDLLSRTLGAEYPMEISERGTFLAFGPHYAAEEVCG